MEPTALAPGIMIAGKYSLDRPLARGAMGEVWIATHRTLGNVVAVKFLARTPAHEGEDEGTAMARFQFEAQVASKLSRRTRHIVAVTDHGEELGFAYLVMELVEGESLETVMRREGRSTLGRLGPIVSQIAKGLTAAHAEGVFHRDLKPANILLTRDEDGQLLVKVLDFGIAKTVRSHRVEQHQVGHTTEVGIVLGTPNYMSPEQARGLVTLDHRCDLWALATIVYESLCGELPYDGETTADLLVNICSVDPVPARKYRPDLPESVEAFFLRAFATKANDRFQDAASLAAHFARVVADAEPKSSVEVRVDPIEIETSPSGRAVVPIAATVAPASDERSITGVVDAVPEPPRSRAPVFVLLAALAVIGAVLFFARGPSTKSEPAAATSASKPERALTVDPASVSAPQSVATATATASPTPPSPTGKPGKPGWKSAPVGAAPSPTLPVTSPPVTSISPPAISAPPPKKPADKGEVL